jgi:hypothetical protein
MRKQIRIKQCQCCAFARYESRLSPGRVQVESRLSPGFTWKTPGFIVVSNWIQYVLNITSVRTVLQLMHNA